MTTSWKRSTLPRWLEYILVTALFVTIIALTLQIHNFENTDRGGTLFLISAGVGMPIALWLATINPAIN